MSRFGLNSRDVDRPGRRGLIVVAAVIVVLFRRPEGDDIDSVRSYHSALGTLEHLSDRTARSSVPVVERDGRARAEPRVPRSYQRSPGAAGGAGGTTGVTAPAVGVDAGGSVPPVPVRGNDEFPDPETPLVFDDARPRDRIRPEGSGEAIPRLAHRPGPTARPRLHEPPAPTDHHRS